MKLEKEFKHAKIESLEEEKIIIITATKEYLPEEQFKDIFVFVLELVKRKPFEKLIFDKREMTVFHQKSMEWYYLEWKPVAAEYGLRTHRKLLGVNTVFNNAVELCKKMMDDANPDAEYHELDLQYKDTIGEAITE